MRLSLRMVGLASTFFWVFLVGFCVSAVYSFKDVRFDFGKLQMDMRTDGRMVFSLPLIIANKGYYDIGAFNLTTLVLDDEGFVVAKESSFVPVIGRGREFVANHNITVNVGDLLQRGERYLFDDTELKVNATLSMKIVEFVPVQVLTDLSLPWHAPLNSFTLEEIECAEHNKTHSKVTVLLDFDNHAFFNFTGSIKLRMYNSSDVLVGEGQTDFKAMERSPFHGFVELYALTSGLTDIGRFEVYFSTMLFDYGPLVIPYG